MRHLTIIAVLAWSTGAWAEEPARPVAPEPGPAATAAPARPQDATEIAAPAPQAATEADAPAPSPTSLEAMAGLGFYESLNVGLSLRTSPRNDFSLFVGWNLSIPEANVTTAGLAWRHALGGPWKGLAKGMVLKAIYWTSEDDLYRWKLLSAEAGVFLAGELRPGTTLAVDAGAVVTFTLESDRLQNQAFGSPTRWNANVCLSLTQRFAAW